jgi:hypothetical protein
MKLPQESQPALIIAGGLILSVFIWCVFHRYTPEGHGWIAIDQWTGNHTGETPPR